MNIEQYVAAYHVEQDRLRAMLPEGFVSLRPVLRFNAEVVDGMGTYVELNMPVGREGFRGWLNIAHWDSFGLERDGRAVTFVSDFLRLKFAPVGVEGGCPVERDNDGCIFLEGAERCRPAEAVTVKKEFCDCEFDWMFHPGDAHGRSIGKTLPAFATEPQTEYEPVALTAENAAAIACEQVLGSYMVRFER